MTMTPAGFYAAQTRHPAFGNTPPDRLRQLQGTYPVLDTMLDLIAIPSATPQADPRHARAVEQNLDRVKQQVIDRVKALGITDIEENQHGSLIIRVPGSKGYENRQPLLLTAHLDIVPGDPDDPTRAITPKLISQDGKEFIGTDGTTTLGSDDKGGVAMILDNLARLTGKHPAQKTPLPHVPLEILFSPDEESSCDSLKKLDGRTIRAKHAIVVDEFDVFKVTTGLASAVMIDINLSGLRGGHSGADITDKSRLNGISLMSEVVQKVKTGVIQMDPHYPNMPLISKNIGMVQAGYAPNAIPDKFKMTVMLRSGDAQAQVKELKRIRQVLDRIEKKYRALEPDIKIGMKAVEEYPAWSNPNSQLIPVAVKAAKAIHGPKVDVGPIHAAAQASILANKTNAYGEPFDSVLIGPHIKDAHTVFEKIEWQSLIDANRWLGAIIQEYTRKSP